MKKALSLLLAILFLFTAMPLSAAADSFNDAVMGWDSGTTGDCTWTLDISGRLTISGNGAMEDYYGGCGPWGTAITSVTIEDGVTDIGDWAFSNCTSLTLVVIPSSVTTIGAYAFEWCTSLMSVIIPSGVTTIAPGTFRDCTALTAVTIPTSVITLGDYAFDGCGSLTDVYYGGTEADRAAMSIAEYNDPLLDATWHYSPAVTPGTNLRVMSYNVLMDDGEGGVSWGRPMDSMLDGTTGYRPDGVVACIARYAPDVVMFQEFSYNWYQSVRAGLADYAFINTRDEGKDDYMCTALMYNTKTLRLVDTDLVGYNNTRWGNQRMRYMNVGVFEIIATGEKFVAISTHLDSGKVEGDGLYRPAQAEQMAAQINAYKQEYGCPIVVAGDFNSSAQDVPISTIVREAQMTVANDGGRDGIDYILMSQGVSCSYYTALSDTDVAMSSDHLPVMADLCVEKYQFPVASGTTGDCTWVLDDSGHLTISGDGAMGDYATFVDENYAPWGDKITSVTIEEGVTTIGSGAFSYCSDLVSVTIPESVTQIATWAFLQCSSLSSVNIPNGVTTIAEYTFSGCTQLSMIQLGDNVRYIDAFAFGDCENLAVVKMPATVTYIEAYAFRNCNNLTDVYYGGTSRDIDLEMALYQDGNEALLNATWTYNWSRHTYDDVCDPDCNVCGEVRVPPHGYSYASDCICDICGLERTISGRTGACTWTLGPDGHLVISGNGAMGDYYHFYDGEESPWSGCRTVTIEEGVTTIGNFAFHSDGVTSITIPSTVTSIGGFAFYYCYVQDVYYAGLPSDRDAMYIGTDFNGESSQIHNATWHYHWGEEHVYATPYDVECSLCGEIREAVITPGDANGDGKVNIRDLGLIQQYIQRYDVQIDAAAADVNGDGKVNIRDLGLLQQYLNGWDVTLG